jgi:hypothetical protein
MIERKRMMKEEEIKILIMKKQSDNRISCEAACDIAEQTGASKIVIGRLLDEMKIKIHSCQLGCFQ